MFPPGREKAHGDNGRYNSVMANNRKTSSLDKQIDDTLRRVYSDTVKEPLPDRFTQLLDQLREKERNAGGETPEDDK